MNQSLALNHAFEIGNTNDGVTLLGLPTERSAKRRMSASADEVAKTIGVVLDEMIVDVIQERTAAGFLNAANNALPRYAEMVLAFARIVTALVPRDKIARMASESFSELEADLRAHGVASFGSDMSERAVFTVWTLRKISSLMDVIERSEQANGHEDREERFARSFLVHALRARFHVDCLTTAMKTGRTLYPDVLPMIDDGLRSAVNAYAWVKQAVDLRNPTDEADLPDYWTEEDQALVDESMGDIGPELDTPGGG